MPIHPTNLPDYYSSSSLPKELDYLAKIES